MRSKIFITLLALFFTLSVYAQEHKKTELVGVVLSTDKSPVPYATIVAKTKKQEMINGVVTDEKGHFQLPLTSIPDSIQVKCLGFEDKTLAYKEVGDTIFMAPQVSALDQVVVVAHRPTVKLNENSIEVGVKGTVLEHETNINDVLRKVPGIIYKEKKITTVEGVEPSFYVNGKKIASLNEIKNLDVKSIKSIDLDTSPGAKYGSTEKAIINIKTTSYLEGISLDGHNLVSVNKSVSHDHSVDFSVKNKSIRIFGGVAYGDTRMKRFQDMRMQIHKMNSDIHTTLDVQNNSWKLLTYNLGAEYNKENNWGAGFKYDGSFDNTGERTLTETEARLSAQTDSVHGVNRVKDNIFTHHLNAYLQKKWSDKFNSNLFLDFFLKKGVRNQSIDELSTLHGDSLFRIGNGSLYSMFSVKPLFTYSFTPNTTSEFGGEYLQVLGTSHQTVNNKKVSDYNTAEITWAGFASLNTKFKGINLQLGVRYENIHGHINNLLIPSQNIKLNYSNLLGDLSLSTRLGDTYHSISLNNSIKRPNFGWLNNETYYSDRYSSQLGNPELKPSLSTQILYNLTYKFIYLELGYVNTKNLLGNSLKTHPDEPNRMLYTWVNYHMNHRYKAVLNLRYSFGFYHPNLTTSFMYDQLVDKRAVGLKTIPLVVVDFNNDFDLPWGMHLNAEYVFTSKSTYQVFTYFPTHIVNLGLSKSFLDGALDLTLKCNDLFKGSISRYYGSVNGIELSQVADFQFNSVSLNLSWRFNKNTQSYKGQSQNETINRL